MATPSTAGRPTPERIFNALNAYQQTAALRAAIELDLFTAIGAGANTASALAAKTGASEKGVRILCDYLTIQGFLTKEHGRYALAQESAIFLDRKSPACVGSMAGFLGTERARSIFDSLTLAVRCGPKATTPNRTMNFGWRLRAPWPPLPCRHPNSLPSCCARRKARPPRCWTLRRDTACMGSAWRGKIRRRKLSLWIGRRCCKSRWKTRGNLESRIVTACAKEARLRRSWAADTITCC